MPEEGRGWKSRWEAAGRGCVWVWVLGVAEFLVVGGEVSEHGRGCGGGTTATEGAACGLCAAAVMAVRAVVVAAVEEVPARLECGFGPAADPGS